MKIDVIVPCFKAHRTLPRLLGSVISQTIVDDLEVTLVNDGDKTDYQEIVEQFKPFIKIQEIKLDKNSGPGAARRIGYEKTKNPLVTWIDADDTFAGAYSLYVLRKELLKEPQNVICVGGFTEEHEEIPEKNMPFSLFAHQQDTVWMFGKLYKRDFLDANNIKMNDTRANEDNGFNMLCKLLTDPQHQIKFIPDIVYYWHFNENSITRINDCQYSYDQSFCGYTDNMIWAIKEAEKRNPFKDMVQYQKIFTMLNLYEYYIETVERDKRFIEQNWGYCKKFYNEVYREIKNKIPDEMLKQAYNDVMRNSYMGNKLAMIIPSISIQEFLNKLEDEYKKQNTKAKGVKND